MKITIELDTESLTPEQLTAVGALIPSPFARTPNTIKRGDVRLVKGDKVKDRSGISGEVFSYSEYAGHYPVHAISSVYTKEGKYQESDYPNLRDIVSVNGILIED